MTRREIFAGNWKMYKTSAEADALVRELVAGLDKKPGREYVIFPPFPYIRDVSAICSGTLFRTGSQNLYHEKQGAFTGEVSPLMVKDCGCSFALIGHSERRHIFHETDSDVNKKVRAALDAGLEPMVCVGELLEEREKGETAKILNRQIRDGLAGFSAQDFARITIAYEPVWAIGTGKVATPEMADEAHGIIRNILKDTAGAGIAENMPVLYGGSVKPDNIDGLYRMDNIDGVLVGGASLESASFLKIINV
ncbi:MAG TPA: triose-phosphate isomerase [Spirochaetota bacterium]|nr:triose-phosphate isomerase [Spirochaetota bacterium]